MLKWFYLQIIYTGFQHDYIIVQNCGGLAEIRGPYLHLNMAINEVKKLAENCGSGWNKSNFFYFSDQYQKSESDAESETSSSRHFQLAKWGSDELLGDQATIAMFLYSNQNHPELKSQYPEWKDRIKQIAKVWKNLPNDKRQPYVQNARENRTASRINKHVNPCMMIIKIIDGIIPIPNNYKGISIIDKYGEEKWASALVWDVQKMVEICQKNYSYMPF